MIKIEVVISQNDIKAVSDALKTINVGGITISKVKGRGKSIVPQIHASKGTGMYTPEFGDKYKLEVVVSDSKEMRLVLSEKTPKLERSLYGQ